MSSMLRSIARKAQRRRGWRCGYGRRGGKFDGQRRKDRIASAHAAAKAEKLTQAGSFWQGLRKKLTANSRTTRRAA
jgi:hypothetical protein